MSTEQEYQKGFNDSYLLAEYEPSLLNSIAKGLAPTTEYLGGFLDGKEQYSLDQTRSQLSELKSLRKNSREHGVELDRED